MEGDQNGNGEVQTSEVIAYGYFVHHWHSELSYSANLPCINVGKPKRPTYYPIELCTLVSLQRYTKALATHQRSSLVEKSRQKSQERMRVLADALKSYNYDADQMLQACGVLNNTHLAEVQGHILQAPKLKVGNGEGFAPRNGRWNFNNKFGSIARLTKRMQGLIMYAMFSQVQRSV